MPAPSQGEGLKVCSPTGAGTLPTLPGGSRRYYAPGIHRSDPHLRGEYGRIRDQQPTEERILHNQPIGSSRFWNTFAGRSRIPRYRRLTILTTTIMVK